MQNSSDRYPRRHILIRPLVQFGIIAVVVLSVLSGSVANPIDVPPVQLANGPANDFTPHQCAILCSSPRIIFFNWHAPFDTRQVPRLDCVFRNAVSLKRRQRPPRSSAGQRGVSVEPHVRPDLTQISAAASDM